MERNGVGPLGREQEEGSEVAEGGEDIHGDLHGCWFFAPTALSTGFR